MTMAQREIKFRAWSESGKRMHYDQVVVLYCLAQQHAHDTSSETPGAMPTDHRSINGMAWMQYTGLKDSGGKEIYEGDVVEYAAQKYRARKYVIETVRGQVVFGPWSNGVQEDRWTYLGPAVKEGSWYGHLFVGRDLTVIGNIHENPELLEK